jgi:ATP adenylyltransferase
MEYILGPKAGPCIFCAYHPDRERHRDNLVLAVTSHAVVMLNRFPFTAGHVLVAPLCHAPTPEALTDEQYAGVMEVLRESIAAVRQAVSPDGLNIGMNLGRAAGAGIADHMHWHLVPRWLGDTNFMPVLADLKVMPEHLEATWERLQPHFAALAG